MHSLRGYCSLPEIQEIHSFSVLSRLGEFCQARDAIFGEGNRSGRMRGGLRRPGIRPEQCGSGWMVLGTLYPIVAPCPKRVIFLCFFSREILSGKAGWEKTGFPWRGGELGASWGPGISPGAAGFGG